jgi:hypothetical protein
MITDDPGTPGDGHWEINLAWTDQRTPGLHPGSGSRSSTPTTGSATGSSSTTRVPGTSSAVGRPGAERHERLAAGREVALLRRGRHGFPAVHLPEAHVPEPGSDSTAGGRPIPTPTSSSPSRWSGTSASSRGRRFRAHLQRSVGGPGLDGRRLRRPQRDEGMGARRRGALQRLRRPRPGRDVVILGSRYDFNEHSTLLVAIGKDVSQHARPAISLLTYLGIQIRI